MPTARSKNTKPELAVRKRLHELGFSFVFIRKLEGKPHIILKVLILFCSWMFLASSSNCSLCYMPKSNQNSGYKNLKPISGVTKIWCSYLWRMEHRYSVECSVRAGWCRQNSLHKLKKLKFMHSRSYQLMKLKLKVIANRKSSEVVTRSWYICRTRRSWWGFPGRLWNLLSVKWILQRKLKTKKVLPSVQGAESSWSLLQVYQGWTWVRAT